MKEDILLTGSRNDLHGRLFHGDQSRGVILAVHGLGDHSGRFASIAQQLIARDWALFAFDLEGHGRSPGKRGHIRSYDGLLSDIAHARTNVGEHLPNVPQVLMGQSMGGNLALNYALRQNEFDQVHKALSGLALVSPMLLPPNPPKRSHIFAAWLSGHMMPWLRFDRPADPEQLTRDSANQDTSEEDRLVHSNLSVYLGSQLLAQGRWAIDQARQVDIPTLVMHGSDDELIDQAACENLAIRIGSNAQYKKLSGLRHDVLRDHDSHAVVDSIIDWCDQTLN